MDLDEWLFYRKKKDPGFTAYRMAREMGISPSKLSLIKDGLAAPTSKQAFLIAAYTNYEVSGWDLIKNIYERDSCTQNEEKSTCQE
jgi:transcriptional regulator with XRE-family HTH domain